MARQTPIKYSAPVACPLPLADTISISPAKFGCLSLTQREP
ncbi:MULTISPECIES: hypothetical protein [unclassified Pseudomonas]|jgi:hypothetical protein|nr:MULTISPECIES: hypothetical protein [unclassified Pseudomonas]